MKLKYQGYGGNTLHNGLIDLFSTLSAIALIKHTIKPMSPIVPIANANFSQILKINVICMISLLLS